MKIARILLVLLLLAGATCADEGGRSTAVLLTARTELPDPNFRDSVVLVMNNVTPLPLGLILNRPTHIPVARLFPDIERLAKQPGRIYFGGPVNPGVVSFIFRADKANEHAIPIVEGIWFSTSEALLRTLLARDEPLEGLRIFVGYSGWGRGQLESEIDNGDWKMQPAKPDVIFEPGAEHPWPERAPPEDERRG
jgi:putative transcriptional regulator